MRAVPFAAILISLAAAGCTTTEYVNPCYGAALVISTDATGDEIVEAADECIEKGGDRKQGLTVRSAGHLRAQRFDDAVADADAAIQIDPAYPDAWYYRGFAHEEAGLYDKAEHDFDKSVELGLAPGFAFRARGRVKFLQNNYVGAYDDFDALIQNNAEDQEAWRMRGAAAAVLERYDQAEADFDRAIALDNGDLKAFSGRAYVKYFTGRYAEAAADFKTALSAKPEGLKAAFLYLAMRRAGDPDAAAELERQAETLDAGSNPGVFPALFLGRVSIEEMVDISIRTGIHKPRENESEGYFYAGMAELFRGNQAAARVWFEKTLATGVIRFDEIRGARKELRAMGITVPSPDPAISVSGL
jgi:lipoprotein NlpI